MEKTSRNDRKRKRTRGLKKIKFYCQMCEKECRDRNGFEAHKRTPRHLRNMEIFASNPEVFVAKYSKTFQDEFLDILKINFQTKKVMANHVHNQYVKDRDAVRMNATRWESLDDFAASLAADGIVHLTHDEQGNPWIQYIDRELIDSRAAVAARDSKRRAHVAAKLAERRTQEMMEAASLAAAASDTTQASDLTRNPGEKTLHLALPPTKKSRTLDHPAPPRQHPPPSQPPPSSSAPVPALKAQAKPMTARERMRVEREAKEQARAAVESWPELGFVVRVMDKTLLQGSLYARKGKVVDVSHPHRPHVAIVEGPDRVLVQVDQASLQSVVPKVGRGVAIIHGHHKGKKGRISAHNSDAGTVSVVVGSSTLSGVPYEHVTKVLG